MKTIRLLFFVFIASHPIWQQALAQEVLTFKPLSTVRTGEAAAMFGKFAAEIVKYDLNTKRMFVVNAAVNAVDVFDVSKPDTPAFVQSIDLSGYGIVTSMDVNPSSDEIAVAIANKDKTKRGIALFLTKDGKVIESVGVGYHPDMLTYDGGGTKVVVANEGEPNEDYSFDPEGSVSIIDITEKSHTHREVTFSHLKNSDVPGVRISGPANTTVAQDLEPEYVAINGSHAYVTLQENSAVAKIDIVEGKIVTIFALGTINHADNGHAFDASDKDGMIRIANWPVRGHFMPDAIATYTVMTGEKSKPKTYFVTANEGDARTYGDYSDEARVEDLKLDPLAFPLADELRKPENLGRLKVITTSGLREQDGLYQQLFSFGTRSFSIFDGDSGQLVFDSGSMIELYIAKHYPKHFNFASDESPSFDSRSDDKGAEPEGMEIGVIEGRTYAFVGLERFSAVIVFDITNPVHVSIAGMAINRDFDVTFHKNDLSNIQKAGDLGPEGIHFISAKDSPNGKPLLMVANEMSGTTTIYQIE